ncbi:hypothetical protein C8R45DRAFT_849923, partial [Mycena sanguinolenta]
ELANLLGCHRMTLFRKMKNAGLTREYSTISCQELDILVKHFKREKPESGLRYLLGFLRMRGIRVQKHRAR